MEDVLKSLEDAKKSILNDILGGEFKNNETHLKGMLAGLDVAIKTVKEEVA